MPLVTCVGLAVQDTVFSMSSPLGIGSKNFADDLRRMGGGPAANAAVAVAALGGSARLISVLGRDATADRIIAELEDRGVSTDRVRRAGGSDSPQSVVITGAAGERTIVNRTDRRLWDAAEPVGAADIERSASVLVDLRWVDGATSAVEQAAAAGIPSVVDYDLTDATPPPTVLGLSSHPIFSEPALARMTGIGDPERAIESVVTRSGFAAVTLGASGVVWRENDQTHRMDAFAVDAKGTLGAGDVFHGAFALGLAQERTTMDNMRWASAASALTCQRGGGRDGIPNGDDVNTFLEEDVR